jgi:hypothetical protein
MVKLFHTRGRISEWKYWLVFSLVVAALGFFMNQNWLYLFLIALPRFMWQDWEKQYRTMESLEEEDPEAHPS